MIQEITFINELVSGLAYLVNETLRWKESINHMIEGAHCCNIFIHSYYENGIPCIIPILS